MNTRFGTVASTLSAHVVVPVGPPVSLAADLRYALTDPFAVCLSLGTPLSNPADWTFSRDLLAEGLRRPTGMGDVLVRASRSAHAVRVTLRNPGGTAVVEIPFAEVDAFLEQTFDLVPSGTESLYVNVDRAIAELTGQIG